MSGPDQDPWRRLFSPGGARVWFVASPRPEFDPKAVGLSTANAWWLAELSRLSYRNSDRTDILAAVGLREIGFVARGGTQCLIAAPVDRGGVYCAFRGTDEPRDWWSNLHVVPTDWPAGGRVHGGFRDAFDDAWDDVAAILDAAAAPVWFCGHSLGGALAQLAATRHPTVACHAYGAPRIGDAAFAAVLAQTPVFRFVLGRDLVPELPPNSPLLNFSVAGDEVRLDPVSSGAEWNAPPAPLGDHAAWGYVEALRRRNASD